MKIKLGILINNIVCFQYRAEGFRGFFKGLVPIALRAWPANAVSNSVPPAGRVTVYPRHPSPRSPRLLIFGTEQYFLVLVRRCKKCFNV